MASTAMSAGAVLVLMAEIVRPKSTSVSAVPVSMVENALTWSVRSSVTVPEAIMDRDANQM